MRQRAIALGLLLLPLISGAAFVVGGAFLAVGQGLAMPTIPSLISTAAASDERGRVLGLSQALTSAARAVGPLWAGFLYDVSFRAPYFAGALLSVAALAVVLQARPRGPAANP